MLSPHSTRRTATILTLTTAALWAVAARAAVFAPATLPAAAGQQAGVPGGGPGARVVGDEPEAEAALPPGWSVVHRWFGPAPGSAFGYAVAGPGDLDGDGFAEVLVGAPRAGDRGAGLVALYSGRDGSSLRDIVGPAPRGKVGQALAGGGDVDGDGVRDWVVGAPGMARNGPDSGMARVISGADGKPLRTLFGGGQYQFFGQSVALVAHVDGEAGTDVLVGATQAPNAEQVLTGGARLVAGATGALQHVWHGNSDAEAMGQSVAAAGDLDGDGRGDVIVGSLGADDAGADAGRAYVFAGRDGSTLLVLDGLAGGDRFGYAVAGVGDVDGDGRGDVLVGAPGHDGGGDEAGAAFVFSGADGSVLHTFVGGTAGDEFGYAVAGAGDVDGDGTPDVIIGGYQLFNDGPGYVRVCSGRDGRLLGELSGDRRAHRFGTAVAGLGDVNGDGRSDVVVGVPQHDAGSGRSVGAAFVYSFDGTGGGR